jgi:hypothetical protein
MRKEVEMNLQLVDILNDWDPFRLGNGSYETEIADVIQAVHELDEPAKLAQRIQSIYEFSFERIIPLEDCRKAADKLLIIKANDSCSI